MWEVGGGLDFKFMCPKYSLDIYFESTYFLDKLPLMGFGWNIAVVLSVFLAQSYTFFTEYLGCILSGGSGKNGSTIAVSWTCLLAYVSLAHSVRLPFLEDIAQSSRFLGDGREKKHLVDLRCD